MLSLHMKKEATLFPSLVEKTPQQNNWKKAEYSVSKYIFLKALVNWQVSKAKS